MKFFSLTLILIMVVPVFPQKNITADEILEKVDENQTSRTIKSKSKMVIHYEGRIIEKRFISYAKGTEKSFSEFTYPSRDKGTKYLKIKDELWMYLPSAEKIIKISGHMLRQSMMGSDFSYEDILEQNTLKEKYDSEITGTDTVLNKECYMLNLTANVKDVTYYRRKLWVDKKKYVILKGRRFAKSGKLLKEYYAKKIEKFEDRYYPTHFIMEDKLRKDSKTEIVLNEIEFDIDLPVNLFSKRNLEKR